MAPASRDGHTERVHGAAGLRTIAVSMKRAHLRRGTVALGAPARLVVAGAIGALLLLGALNPAVAGASPTAPDQGHARASYFVQREAAVAPSATNPDSLASRRIARRVPRRRGRGHRRRAPHRIPRSPLGPADASNSSISAGAVRRTSSSLSSLTESLSRPRRRIAGRHGGMEHGASRCSFRAVVRDARRDRRRRSRALARRCRARGRARTHRFAAAVPRRAGSRTRRQMADDLCAWVRLPAHERDVQASIVELRSRASIARPILGDHGLLWRGREWVALSPIEARLTAAFVARPGRVLSRARLERTGWPDGTPNDRSVDAAHQGVAPPGGAGRPAHPHGAGPGLHRRDPARPAATSTATA